MEHLVQDEPPVPAGRLPQLPSVDPNTRSHVRRPRCLSLFCEGVPCPYTARHAGLQRPPPGRVARAAPCSAAHRRSPWPVSWARPVGPQWAHGSVPTPSYLGRHGVPGTQESLLTSPLVGSGPRTSQHEGPHLWADNSVSISANNLSEDVGSGGRLAAVTPLAPSSTAPRAVE